MKNEWIVLSFQHKALLVVLKTLMANKPEGAETLSEFIDQKMFLEGKIHEIQNLMRSKEQEFRAAKKA